MSHKFLRLLMLLSIALLGACGAADTSDSAAGISSSISLPGLTPVPADPASGKPAWNGSAVELMFADALASCAYNPNPSPPIAYPFDTKFVEDEYVRYVQTQMRTATCRYTDSGGGQVVYLDWDNPEWGWLDQRKDKNCNVDPSTKAKTAVALTRSVPAIEVPVEAPFGGDAADTTAWSAARSLKTPITNLCIAQTLRGRAPGASGGEALLLSAADQRQLLALQKERAQMAMLQIALLGEVFATPALADPGKVSNVYGESSNNGYPYSYFPMLQQWAQGATGDRAALIRTLGDELASAVQLHVSVSAELAQLLNRSGSARLPRGTKPDPVWIAAGHRDSVVDMWGPGSWRQRAMASLYGGDPLVEDPSGSTPWKHFSRQKSPSRFISWPDSGDAPFVSSDLADPKVPQLFALAKDADELYLAMSTEFEPTETWPFGAYACRNAKRQLSADRLYRAVEAYIRTNQCRVFQPASSNCKQFVVADIPDSRAGYSEFDLWTKYRISPSHAHQLVASLDEIVPKYCSRMRKTFPPGGGSAPGQPVYIAKRGPVDFSGETRWWSMEDDTYHHIRSFDPKPRVLRETAGLYTRHSYLTMPTQIYPDADPATQGFQLKAAESTAPGANPHEEMRLMGAVSALVATRDALLSAIGSATTSPAPESVMGFFARVDKTLAVIESAVGRSGVSINPVAQIADRVVLAADGRRLNKRVVAEASDASGASLWTVDVVADRDDTFWNQAESGKYRLFAAPDDAVAASLAAYERSKLFGLGITDSLSAPGVAQSGSPVVREPSLVRSRVWRFQLSLPRTDAEWALIVRKEASANPSPTYTYQPLLTQAQFFSDNYLHQYPVGGQYFAFNGSLSNFAARIIALDMNQPSMPAFDGFGLPAAWLPPSDPALFGGSAGDDVVANYLLKARGAAEEATAAVKEAFEEMLKQQESEALLAASVAKSEKVGELERSALCGSSTCDTSMQHVQVDVETLWNSAPSRTTLQRQQGSSVIVTVPVGRSSWAQYRQVCTPNEGESLEALLVRLNPDQRLDCLAIMPLARMQASFKVLSPVATQQNAPAVPSFSEYSGGTLQAVAIEQWTALRLLKDKIRSFIAATDAAIGHVELFQNELDRGSQQNQEMAKRCEHLELEVLKEQRRQALFGEAPITTVKAFEQLTWEDEISRGKSDTSGGSFGLFGIGGSASWTSSKSEMSLGAKRRLCESYRDKVDGATWRLTEALTNAYASIQQRSGEFTEATARVQSAAASGASLSHKTELAIAAGKLESDLLRVSQKTSFGLYRQVHSYDAWRAKALLESARMSAVVARKAIESRYLVNLSSLSAPEPLVASPSSWADEVYEYDLDMPAAVGLAVGEAVPSGIYPNRVLDYVGNLQRFVDGYSMARPAAVADGDTEVVSLAGPKGRVDGSPPSGTMFPDGSAYAWSYFCPEGSSGAWRPMPPNQRPSEACLPAAAHPTRARILFALDAWGRLHGDLADEPFQKRYNARWKSLAINLVGTGILDCSKARDPLACQSQPFLRYRLSHGGAPWVTAADQSWSILPVPTGRVEGAKALAAEQWFDPIENSWSKPFVAAVTRGEFVTRPFGGTYELEFDIGDEVVLERIDRVQLLASSNYWVKQQ